MICVGLFIMFCQMPAPAVADSFCAVYQKVVRAPSDGAIRAGDGVRRRIAANEVVYRCQCDGWKSPRCR